MSKKNHEPEVVDEGVTRAEPKENPMDQVAEADSKKVRAPGKWKKATIQEVAQLEAEGKLKGYDPEKGEVLIKE